jgi:hypothetical protein
MHREAAGLLGLSSFATHRKRVVSRSIGCTTVVLSSIHAHAGVSMHPLCAGMAEACVQTCCRPFTRQLPGTSGFDACMQCMPAASWRCQLLPGGGTCSRRQYWLQPVHTSWCVLAGCCVAVQCRGAMPCKPAPADTIRLAKKQHCAHYALVMPY